MICAAELSIDIAINEPSSHIFCRENRIDVNYWQSFTHQIELVINNINLV